MFDIGSFRPLFGDRLKKARKNTELTQAELARNIGVDIKTYRNWELGKVVPDGYFIFQLCKALDCDFKYLTGEINDFHDNRSVSEITGLSYDAVETFKNIKKENFPLIHAIDIVNYLFSVEKNTNILLLIYHYLLGNYKETKNGEEIIELLDETKIGCNGVALTVTDLNALFLSMIIEQLAILKTRIDSEVPSMYGKHNNNKLNSN